MDYEIRWKIDENLSLRNIRFGGNLTIKLVMLITMEEL